MFGTKDEIELLYVEDNQTDVAYLQFEFAKQNRIQVNTTHVVSIEEARRVLPKHKFDLILLDLTLPDAEGMEALLSIQAMAPDIPIVIYTGRNDSELAAKAVRSGAEDVVYKGAVHSGQKVLSQIESALEKHPNYLSKANATKTSSNCLKASALDDTTTRKSLRQSAPRLFDELSRYYSKGVDLLEPGGEKNLQKMMGNLAEQAVYLGLTVDDIQEIHEMGLAVKFKTDRERHRETMDWHRAQCLLTLFLKAVVSYYTDHPHFRAEQFSRQGLTSRN